jgi:15-cis-phytoene synthase
VSPAYEASPDDFAACRAMLRRGSRSFSAAALLLPERVREPAAALYAFCRVADDAIDQSHDPGAVDLLRRRIELVYQGRPSGNAVDRALTQIVAEHDLPRPLIEALIEGFAWDAEGRRYTTISELSAYGARVAGTVGAMMTVLMGPRSAEVMARACDLGVAMQLTNIARDVGEDARAGRLYLPLSWLEEADISPGAFLRSPSPSRGLTSVIERLLRYADVLYIRSDSGIALLPPDCRMAIRAARLIYADIGREIARAGYDSVSRRAYTSPLRKLWLVLRAFFARAEELRAPVSAPPLPETAFLVSAAILPGARSEPPQLNEATT